jgi:catechol 2,3-dioxygenase-like lactoylglutathione lyase family enzyme
MTIRALDHVNVWTTDLEATRRFYIDVLGLREGDRPAFQSVGAWLYADEAPLVHVVARDDARDGPTGAFDHIAFQAQDLDGMIARLDERGIEYAQRKVPGRGITQLFLHDPNGVQIELSFAASESPPAGA